MRRRYLSSLASLAFAVYWALLQWPWMRVGAAPTNNHLAGWSMCALFALVSAGLAAGWRWASWLGLAAAIVGTVLLPFGLLATYFVSLFGDQAYSLREAAWFLAGIALSVALLISLPRRLGSPLPRQGPPARRS